VYGHIPADSPLDVLAGSAAPLSAGLARTLATRERAVTISAGAGAAAAGGRSGASAGLGQRTASAHAAKIDHWASVGAWGGGYTAHVPEGERLSWEFVRQHTRQQERWNNIGNALLRVRAPTTPQF
jgi:hypothetical protein